MVVMYFDGDCLVSVYFGMLLLFIELGVFFIGVMVVVEFIYCVWVDLCVFGGLGVYVLGFMVGFIGDVVVFVEEIVVLMEDFIVFLGLVVGVVVLVLLFYFCWWLVIVVFIVLFGVVMLCVFVLVSLFGICEFNFNMVFFGLIIVGNGINFGII